MSEPLRYHLAFAPAIFALRNGDENYGRELEKVI